MTATMRVQRLTVAAAVLATGAFVAGPANAATGGDQGETVTAKSETATAKSAVASSEARGARKKVKCALGLQFKPRVGKGNRWIRSKAVTKCNTKVPKIWTSVRLVQTKAPDKYKKTSKKRGSFNKSTIRTFCPREYRKYTVIGKTTVKLPKGSKKKFLRITKKGHQAGVCR